MNEENTNNAVQQTAVNPVETQAAVPQATVDTPVVTPTESSTQPQVVVQPASEPAPQPQVIPQPASEPAPQPQVIPQPAAEAAPVPTQVANTTEPVASAVAPQAQPVENIAAGQPINPITSNPQPVSQPAPPAQTNTQTVVAPSNPLNSDIDPNIGFVAVGESLKKKKNVPLIVVVTVLLLVGLGALSYFVIYPFAVKQFTKPEKIYNAVIDSAFKELNTTVSTISHNRATYTAEIQIDTNVENLKDLTGYTYTGNFGIDPENKNIQLGVNIKDADSQEHSAHVFVKGDRQYLRLSSYRELIYLGTTSEYKETWDKLYDVFDDINQKDSEYLVTAFQNLLKNSIVQSKLSKEDASVTINGKTYKVLNNKYTIDNDTLVTMYKSIRDGLKEDTEAIKILSKNMGLSEEELIKELDKIEIPEKILEENELYYFNIYTYSVKTIIVGIELTNGEDSIRYYTLDGYSELKINSKQENVETGKEEIIDITAKAIKQDGKTKVTVTSGDKEIARFVISVWDEKAKEFTYEIILEDQTLTGEIKLNCDINEDRAKYDFKGSLKIDKDYLNISMSITNDWTSEVANVNASTAKTLDDNELQAKINEFITTLKNTPLARMFTTTSGEFDDSIFKYRSDGGTKAMEDNCSPGTNCVDDVVESQEDNGNNVPDNGGNEI